MRRWSIALFTSCALGLVACSQPGTASAETDLILALSAHCGQAFAGQVTSAPDERDAAFAAESLVMHVRDCADDEVRVPFHVGTDHSRTWVITRLEDGRMRLKHDHRHEDGSEDVLTQYGGDSVAAPVTARVEFPADAYSRELFEREGIPVSMDNVWTAAIEGDAFIYALNRPGRSFEVTFDLTAPVPVPPAAWGYEG